jgi:hypothetical protein
VLREGLKCHTSCTSDSLGLLPVPGTKPRCTPPQLAEVVHLGRQYDFSKALSLLPNMVVEAVVSRALERRRKTKLSSPEQC